MTFSESICTKIIFPGLISPRDNLFLCKTAQVSTTFFKQKNTSSSLNNLLSFFLIKISFFKSLEPSFIFFYLLKNYKKIFIYAPSRSCYLYFSVNKLFCFQPQVRNPLLLRLLIEYHILNNLPLSLPTQLVRILVKRHL